MIPFSWRAERDLANEAASLSVRQKIEAESRLAHVSAELELERTRRISAEAVAVERKAEVERLIAEVERLQSVLTERAKSLDALNLKLMETKTPEPLPDIKQFNPVAKQAMQAITQIKDIHRQMDWQILTKLHPKFANLGNSRNMNAPQEEPVSRETQEGAA